MRPTTAPQPATGQYSTTLPRRFFSGLTATPERMDGDNVAADFGNRFAAEIRLPEALEEKLLCPFHYFGVADPDRHQSAISSGATASMTPAALENVYVLRLMRGPSSASMPSSHALQRYEPELSGLKGLGFCVAIRHAVFMAEQFTQRGIPSAAIVSGVDECTLCANCWMT